MFKFSAFSFRVVLFYEKNIKAAYRIIFMIWFSNVLRQTIRGVKIWANNELIQFAVLYFSVWLRNNLQNKFSFTFWTAVWFSNVSICNYMNLNDLVKAEVSLNLLTGFLHCKKTKQKNYFKIYMLKLIKNENGDGKYKCENKFKILIKSKVSQI